MENYPAPKSNIIFPSIHMSRGEDSTVSLSIENKEQGVLKKLYKLPEKSSHRNNVFLSFFVFILVFFF